MALPSTVRRFEVQLADVDRGVYESLDLRLAQHPSEALPYLVTRLIAYCLCYEEGIAFGRGLDDADEPSIAVRDATGNLRVWIDIGLPSADRIHRASKAAPRVVIFTHRPPALLQREAARQRIHRVEAVEVRALPAAFVEAVAAKVERHTRLELTRSDAHLYLKVAGGDLDAPLAPVSLVVEG